ncbi:MAG TPA: phosphoglycerate kinase [Actinobacteria bacterium]|nr:phosphoglycerate kinase [Actinomycetota bacterium]
MSPVVSLSDLAVSGRTVLLRADFNVPLDTDSAGNRVITDDGRIRAALPTIQSLTSQGAKVVVLAHLGRPKGMVDEALSLRPVAARLSELLGTPVVMADDVCGDSAKSVVAKLRDGEVALLENVRFDPRETSKDIAERTALASVWASLGDCFVSDGFGVVHREQASVTELPQLLPHAAGLLVAREAEVFNTLITDPARPYTVVLGGSKVSDKLGVIENLIGKVDRLLIGGGMCFTFLVAQGYRVGSSLVEADQVEVVKGFLADARERGVDLVLPTDLVIADAFAADANNEVVSVEAGVPEGWMGLDIGPESAARFAQLIEESETVVWNGPMGVFEMAPFAAGTRAVGEALTRVDGMSVVGGGDSAAAVRLLGIDETRISHISTGGGASLEFLEGRTLPGLAVLAKS